MAGFAFLLLLDWAECRRLGALKTVSLALAALAIAGSTAALIASPPKLVLPLAVRAACGAAAAVFLFLLFVSLFVEVPLLGDSKEKPRLRTTGTYALVRHPGVIWLLFLHVALSLASGSLPLLLATPFWTGANLVLVSLEDSVFFPRLFGPPYLEYRRAVPFLVPTRASFGACLATFRLSRRR